MVVGGGYKGSCCSSSPAPPTTAPATEYMNYVVTNTSLLPVGVSNALAQLETEWKEGDLTRRGYLKRRSQLLEEYPYLRTTNGSVVFGEGVGQVGGATRRLLSVLEGKEAISVKSLQDDISRAVTAWEHMYGPWVRGWSQVPGPGLIMM